MEPFARFNQQLGHDDPRAIESLLEGIRGLVADQVASRSLLITDAILPGFMWLVGRYPVGRVEEFKADLDTVLRPLHPLHVYLTGDAAGLFGRAVAQRGTEFQDRMIGAVKRWHTPHYPGGARHTDADVMQFYTWLDSQTTALLTGGPARSLILDATIASAEELTDTILNELQNGDAQNAT